MCNLNILEATHKSQEINFSDYLLSVNLKGTLMNCPRCSHDLKTKTIRELSGEIEVDHCESCEGIWFDQGELRPLDLVVEHCPKCQDEHIEMEKVNHPRDSRIIIDQCPNCKGIWVDKGEIEGIQKENIFKVIFRLMFN